MNKKTERASKEAGPVGTKLIMAPTNGPSPKAISQREVAVFPRPRAVTNRRGRRAAVSIRT